MRCLHIVAAVVYFVVWNFQKYVGADFLLEPFDNIVRSLVIAIAHLLDHAGVVQGYLGDPHIFSP